MCQTLQTRQSSYKQAAYLLEGGDTEKLASQVGASGEGPACQCRRHRRCHEFYPWVGKIPWRRLWQPTPVFLPGES